MSVVPGMTAAPAGSEAAALAKAMLGASVRLAPPRLRIEAAFTELAARLGDGAGVAAELGAVSADAIEHLRAADIDATVSSLRAVADAAAVMGERFRQERDAMDRLREAIGAGVRPLDSLDRAIRTIGIIATVARVASAPLVNSDNDIGFFSTDLVKLSEAAALAVRAFTETHRRILREVQEAALRQARFEQAYRERLLDLPRRFELRLAAMAEHRRGGEAAGESVSRTSQEVTRRISEAVSALQVGDAARQRIEHVETGLARLARAGAGGEAGLEALSIGASLQAALLEEATQVFTTEAGAARRRIDELAQDASRILAEGRGVVSDAAAGGSPLEAVQAELLTANDLLRACERERRELDALASSVSSAIALLFEQLETVQRTEVEMQLLAVNAAIRCSRLGSNGRALSVISEQLTDLTNETRRAVKEASEELEHAAEPAKAIAGASTSGGSDEILRLEAEAKASMRSLAELDDKMRNAGEALNQQAPRAADFLRRGAAAFEVLDTVLAELALERDAMRSLARPASGRAPAPEEAETLFAELRRTYTIEAERKIHDRLIGAPPPSAMTNASSAEEDWEMFG